MPRTLEHAMEARSTAHAIAADANTRDPAARVRLALNGAIRLLIQAAVFIALVSLFFFRVPQVEGRSMLPNIEGGNHVLINTLAYGIALDPWVLTSNPIDRGDIVAFERGQGDDQRIFLKRVIALPGESVALTDGAVVVQGVTQHEDYNPMHDRSNMHVTVVPAGSVFVLGDNRAESDDSRSFGPVSQSSIIGKALFVIWPLGHVKRIH